MVSVRVPRFDPKTSGFGFENRWAPGPTHVFKLGTLATLTLGEAANGLCGGMSHAIRDFHQFGVKAPADTKAFDPQQQPARFTYVVDRQVDSLDTGKVPLRFWSLMKPSRPERETLLEELLGRVGVDRHSRTWTMVRIEWPKIKRDLDGGSLSSIGLVRSVSSDIAMLNRNHQVVAYGYDLDGTKLTLRIADPNYPRADDVTLKLDIGDPRGSVTPVWSRANPPYELGVVCFFQAPYTARDPRPTF